MNKKALFSSRDVSCVLSEHPDGTVHSVFDHSFNVRFNNRLVHIGSASNGRVPYGIGLSKYDLMSLLETIRVTNEVHWQRDQMQLIFPGTGESVSLYESKKFDPFLPACVFDKAILKRNISTAVAIMLEEEWEAGFEEDTDALVEAVFSFSPWMAASPVLKTLNDLKAFLSGYSDVKGETLITFWLGRGKGLTPSGDDLLVGALAMLTASGRCPEAFKNTLYDYLKLYGLERTTQISFEYLWYAVQQKFASHVTNVCQSLLRDDQDDIYQSVRELKKVGHTSSTDTMIGILIGCQCIIGGNK
ncbi:DUF2877 domain-containing protein [Scopulibacillus cellulosilyticus]|uniref:DUF2877 domain-containing protein n=1 Tax=Scopulibacillus cellulosilyticus TaxID=2665665 RepID=A0ABW2PZ04_9BACL